MLVNQIRESVRQAVLELASAGGYRTYLGEYSESLSSQLCLLIGVPDCLLVSSGTAALEIGLRAAGIGPGDEVILSAYDYAGNFWAIERVGARPVLVDTEPDSWRLSLSHLESICDAEAGKACKAVIASHLHGQLQDSEAIREFCDARGKLFFEDCCQAVGAQIVGRTAGSFGHMAILSFGGGKLLSAGRGGGLLTSDPELAQKARVAAGAGSGPYRLSECQAAVVMAQLPWLPQLNDCCRRFFGQVQSELARWQEQQAGQIILPCERYLSETSFYQAGWLVSCDSLPDAADGKLGIADRLVDVLRAQDIPAGRGFAGFHRRSARRCRVPYSLVNTPKLVEKTLVIHHDAALEERALPHEIAVNITEEFRRANRYSS